MKTHAKTKLACYTTNVTMSIISSLSPLLFLTFKSLYDISYTLLGLLVLVNFFTQLIVDLIFSFFSHKFNIPLVVKLTPLIAIIGLLLYGASPFIFPNATYAGLLISTVIFSASSGLAEVLISPVIAAIPAENPEHEMSKLHSIYAWGVVGTVGLCTLYLLIFGNQNWFFLPFILAIVPLISTILFFGSDLPPLETPERVSGAISMLKKGELWLSVVAIFLGGAIECTMAQWCSSYVELALGIDKVWGDVFGAALFAFTLGLGRTLYAKRGKRIERVLLLCAIGSALCYATAAISPIPVLGLVACAMTGLCASMLWPGNLIVASDKFPHGGVFIYAMMAAGGDFGASVGPQLVGVITDAVASWDGAGELASTLSLSPEQLAMKCAMLIGLIFSAVAIIITSVIYKKAKNKQAKSEI